MSYTYAAVDLLLQYYRNTYKFASVLLDSWSMVLSVNTPRHLLYQTLAEYSQGLIIRDGAFLFPPLLESFLFLL